MIPRLRDRFRTRYGGPAPQATCAKPPAGQAVRVWIRSAAARLGQSLTSRAMRAAVLIALLLALAACQTAQPAVERFRAERTRTVSLTFDPGAIPAVTITGGAGQVTISAGAPEGTLELTITKIAYGISQKDAEQELDDVRIALEQDGERLRIDTQQRQAEGQRANAVDLQLTVPQTVALEVTLFSGDLTLTGITAAGPLALHTYAGTLSVADVRAPQGLALQNGAGSITFSGTLGTTGDYSMRASAGQITARLPAETRATIEARAVIGSVRVQGATLSQVKEERRGAGMTLSGALGSGGPLLRLEIQTGDIAIVVAAP